MPTPHPRRDVLWNVLLVFVMFILATVVPAMKTVSGRLHPLSISFFRYFFGVLPLVPLYVVERRRIATGTQAELGRRQALRRDRWVMGLLGLPGIAVFSVCLTYGIKLSTAYNGSLLANSQPIFTTLLAPLMIKEESSTLRLASSFAGVVGVALVVAGGARFETLGGMLTQRYFWGNLLLVGGAISISLYTILLKRYVVRFGGLVPTFLSMLSGAVALFLVARIVTGRVPFGGVHGAAPWLTLAYIGVIGTALVYPLFNLALKSAGVVRAVGFKLLVPVFGIVLSCLFLGERPGALTYVGAAVVIVSVFMIQRVPVRRGGSRRISAREIPGKITSETGGDSIESVKEAIS